MANAVISYGTDITFDGSDITPGLLVTVDSSVVLEALAMRLQSDEGSLWYDPNYGYNINNLFKSPILMSNGGVSKITTRIENECLKDTRVKKAVVSITDFSLQTKTMKITIEIGLVNGEQNSLVFDINE
jgi:hypothetical protein